ncbi:MAG: branched-chain-amino-acid transaminase [Verrucomicrobia bacterium]|nr:branched-chain-amino-acid transaminase [Verrucomicrobiota bacterium]
MKVYINGEYFDKENAKISVFDHGLLYGDGVFEGIRLYSGCVFKLDEHLDRLEKSAKAILLSLPWTRAELSEAVCATCRANNLRDGYIRLVVTRGVGSLGLSHKTCSNPQLIIIADKISLYPQEYYTQGLKIVTSPTRRVNPAAFPPMVKSLNYLNNIMAKADANMSGCLEALMLNDQGYIAECTGDNVFIRHGDVWLTPAYHAGALKGITRGVAIECIHELGLKLVETNITRYEAWTADEMFLTGTAAEIIPVVEVDTRVIGDGTPGSQTAKLLEIFQRKVKVEGTMIE